MLELTAACNCGTGTGGGGTAWLSLLIKAVEYKWATHKLKLMLDWLLYLYEQLAPWIGVSWGITAVWLSQPVKIDLSKKLDPKQKKIQAFNIDA